MKNNIIVVGFLKEFIDGICLELSKELNMFYANVSDMVSYELINADEMITVCGIEYYEAQEAKVLKRLSTFENTIFSFDYNYYCRFGAKYFSESCNIIYLKFSQQKLEKLIKHNNDLDTWASAIDVVDYQDRNKTLSNSSDLVVCCDRLCQQTCCKKIIEYLKKVGEL